MAIHEIEKNIKIIDEIVMYLFDKGYTDFDFSLNITPEESMISVKVLDKEKELIEIINNEIFVERDEELEDYGWELLGECFDSRETICLGMLVDKMETFMEGNFTKIIFHRKH